MSNTKSLKKLGSKTTEYQTDKVRPELLETFDNLHESNSYLVPFIQERDEFTSLCPRTKQPDHAKLEIVYVPNVKMVESKSLKLYLFSFRNTGEFHEDVINRIAKDLYDLLKPRYIRVYGDFAPRGGLAIKPLVQLWGEFENVREVTEEIKHLVMSFDLKK